MCEAKTTIVLAYKPASRKVRSKHMIICIICKHLYKAICVYNVFEATTTITITKYIGHALPLDNNKLRVARKL